MRNMRAIVWDGPLALRLASCPQPAIQSSTDALVDVEHASTCGTDLHIYRGAVPSFQPGTIIGHEFIGTVAEVGSAVQRLRVGQRVRCSDFTACGACLYCRARHYSLCAGRMLFGFSGIQPQLHGGLAERVRVPQADIALLPLPATAVADPRLGLLAADVLPTALGALRHARLRPGQHLAVIGGGPVGALTTHLAALRDGYAVLFEADARRADRLRAAGLTTLTGAPRSSATEHDFDVVIDAAGGQGGLTAALSLVRPGGRIVGIGSQGGSYAVDWGELFQKQIGLRFVIGDPIGLRRPVDAALEECRPILDLIFSDPIALEAVPEHFAKFERRECFKAVVRIAGGCA